MILYADSIRHRHVSYHDARNPLLGRTWGCVYEGDSSSLPGYLKTNYKNVERLHVAYLFTSSVTKARPMNAEQRAWSGLGYQR